jgi:hypothetical protein
MCKMSLFNLHNSILNEIIGHIFFFKFQADILINFYIGEVVTSLQKATLIPGGSESLVYTTLSGGIGMLVPFTSHEVIYHNLCFQVVESIKINTKCLFLLGLRDFSEFSVTLDSSNSFMYMKGHKLVHIW